MGTGNIPPFLEFRAFSTKLQFEPFTISAVALSHHHVIDIWKHTQYTNHEL